jgi:hypothetical protein
MFILALCMADRGWLACLYIFAALGHRTHSQPIVRPCSDNAFTHQASIAETVATQNLIQMLAEATVASTSLRAGLPQRRVGEACVHTAIKILVFL